GAARDAPGSGRARRSQGRSPRAYDLVGRREGDGGGDGARVQAARLSLPRRHRPLALPSRGPDGGAGRRAGRAEREARPVPAAQGCRGQHQGGRHDRRAGRDARDAGMGDRLAPHELRQEPDRAGAGRDGQPARRLHRASHRAQDRQARRGGGGHRAGDREGGRDRHRARDRLTTRPAGHVRFGRAARRRGRCADRRDERRAPALGARLRRDRRGAGAPRVADEAASPQHAHLAPAREAEEMSFREDGQAALEWAARYLERVGEYPVLAQVEPGALRAKLPPSPPDEGEPFAAILRDLDELLLPAMTHWQSPRFFAYFANTASEPGILAELLIAATNQNGILWRTSPALTELELHVADWTAQLLGLPAGWHGHVEDSASTSTFAAVIAARQTTGGSGVVCSEHAHSSVEKAGRMLGLDVRK